MSNTVTNKKSIEKNKNVKKMILAIRIIKSKYGFYSFEKKMISNNEIKSFFSQN
ncbi:DUF4295 domain-containing protein [Blattabacterium cuenoti]|uniref:DUF4295 domain-containing protein n=1 Tax=Blattabacterium cuenoti TaxID=1653831 RepID=UPI00163C2B10|nr:DUF4295 domain-containing protein [Blattabacterium cuenoti]